MEKSQSFVVVWMIPFPKCYGTPYLAENSESFWASICKAIKECTVSWLLMGDLNEIVDEFEKKGDLLVFSKPRHRIANTLSGRLCLSMW